MPPTAFLPLPLLDPQDHALAVDGWGRESHRFGDPQARGVAGREDRTMLGERDAVEKLDDLGGAEHHRQGPWRSRCRDDGLHRPRLLERDLVQEAQRGDGDDQRRRAQLLLVGQIDLVRDLTSTRTTSACTGAASRTRATKVLRIMMRALLIGDRGSGISDQGSGIGDQGPM